MFFNNVGLVDVAVVYHVIIVENGHGELKKFEVVLVGCVLRTAGSFQFYTWGQAVCHEDDVVGVVVDRDGADLVDGGVDVVLVDVLLLRLHYLM